MKNNTNKNYIENIRTTAETKWNIKKHKKLSCNQRRAEIFFSSKVANDVKQIEKILAAKQRDKQIEADFRDSLKTNAHSTFYNNPKLKFIPNMFNQNMNDIRIFCLIPKFSGMNHSIPEMFTMNLTDFKNFV